MLRCLQLKAALGDTPAHAETVCAGDHDDRYEDEGGAARWIEVGWSGGGADMGRGEGCGDDSSAEPVGPPHATMLVYLFTDLVAESEELGDLLEPAVERSFNSHLD